jgi:hypothetical protein
MGRLRICLIIMKIAGLRRIAAGAGWYTLRPADAPARSAVSIFGSGAAKVAELVNALDLGSSAARLGGSSPSFRTSLAGRWCRPAPAEVRITLDRNSDGRIA